MNRVVRNVLALAALAFGGASLTACGPDFDHVSIDGVVTAGNGTGAINTARITVQEGMVLKAHIVPYNDDNEIMLTRLETHDGRFIGTSYVISDQDFAFYGISAGETDIDVFAEGKLVLVLHAVVTPQPPQ